MELYSRFISGFYKATNGEEAASHYFTKTELIPSILENFDSNASDLIGQILIEYAVFLENAELPQTEVTAKLDLLAEFQKFSFFNVRL